MEHIDTYLFIGGPLDGKRIITEPGLDEFKHLYNNEIVHYTKEAFSYGDNFYFFWVAQGLEVDQAVVKLFQLYKSEKDCEPYFTSVGQIEYIEIIDKHLAEGGMLYNAGEGQQWQKLELNLTVDEVIVRLYNRENWITTNTSIPGHINRTYIMDDAGEIMIVSAVKFPDGRIWDSYLRKFRDEVKKGD